MNPTHDPIPSRAAPATKGLGEAARIVIVYATFASTWILFSDQLVAELFHNPSHLAMANTVKGWLFVAVTSVLLYWQMRRRTGLVSGEIVPGAPFPIRTFLVVTVAIIATTSFAIKQVYQEQREKQADRLITLAQLKVRQIADWLGERQGDANFVHTNAFYAETYFDWRKHGDNTSLTRLRQRIDEFRRDHGVAGAMLLDEDGKSLWDVGTGAGAVHPPLAEAARLASRERKMKVIGPYRDETGRLHVDYIIPLIKIEDRPPSVVLHIEPGDWLFPTLRFWPTPSPSGETLMFRRDGDHVLFLNELRHRGNTAANFRVPVSQTRVLAVQALLDKNQLDRLLEGVDYRGVPAVGVVKAIPGSDWYLVAKLDQSEFYGPAHQISGWIALIGVLVLFATFAGLVLSRQRQALDMAARSNAAQMERLRALRLLAAIADSSEDAIVAKDLHGRYLLFNRAAERFIGKPAAEVLGLDDYALFPPEQADQLRRFGERALAENRVITEEVVLTTQFGARTFLATKGPLLDDESHVIGQFGITRDITDHKQSEARLSEQVNRFRTLLDQSRDGVFILDQNLQIIEANQRFADMLGYAQEELFHLHAWDFDALQDERAIREGIIDLSAVNRSFVTRHRRKDGIEYDVEISASGTQWAGRDLVLCICRDISERLQAEKVLRRQTEELTRRNEELERFNRATVGRELKMIELKQQVNALARELGREPPHPLDFLDADGEGNRP